MLDPNAVLEAIGNGLAQLPSAIIAAVILAGPTAVWLITRLMYQQPTTIGGSAEPIVGDVRWICWSCRSINDDRDDLCYRCGEARSGDGDAVLIDVGPPGEAEVGVPVGPGLPAPDPAYTWLGGELAGASRPFEGGMAVEPARAADADARDRPDPDELDPDEPMILDPWVKVSGRPSPAAPKPRRARRKPAEQDDANAKPSEPAERPRKKRRAG